MDKISEEEFEKAKMLEPEKVESEEEENMDELLEELKNPVDAQKALAVKIRKSLDKQIKMEMEKKGVLSDYTRRWVESYNKILGDIQKALHGDKSVNFHLHKVSHGDIAQKMRESVIILDGNKSKKIEDEEEEE